MTILTPNTSPITRVYINDLQGLYDADPNRDQASTILDYHDGNDVVHIKAKMAEMFATEIRKTRNTQGEIITEQVKTKAAQVAAIRNNLFEIDPRGTTRKITNNIATLAENTEFKYTDEQFGEDIAESRDRAGFDIMFGRLDEISVVVGSSVFLTQVNNGDFQEQALTPDKVWILFGKELEVDGELIPVDNLKIDHAQCVVIQVDKEKFAAYFGRSTEYPNGRFVQYEAKNWYSIPEVGVEGANDYTVGDDEFSAIYNPLTMYQDDYNDYTTPEYPIITWQGTTRGIGTRLLSVHTNLYDSSREIDLSASRLLMAANKGARGAWFFTNEGGASPVQPSSLDEGISKLEAGQGVMVLSVPSSNVDIADKVIKGVIGALGDSYGLAQHELMLDSSVVVPSGTALQLLSKPKADIERKRKRLNDAQMERQFKIEKCLATIENGSLVGEGVEQMWVLKPKDALKTDTELIAEQKELIAIGVTDKAHALAELKGITVEEAQAELDLLVVAPVANTTANRLGI